MPTNRTRTTARSGGNRSNANRGGNRGGGRSAGILDVAREAPLATAAAAAGAVAAGVFLWSKRAQISDQINEWTDSLTTSGDEGELEFAGTAASNPRGRSTSMSETGGGNAALGAQTGGGGLTSTASGRGRARSTTPRATRG